MSSNLEAEGGGRVLNGEGVGGDDGGGRDGGGAPGDAVPRHSARCRRSGCSTSTSRPSFGPLASVARTLYRDVAPPAATAPRISRCATPSSLSTRSAGRCPRCSPRRHVRPGVLYVGDAGSCCAVGPDFTPQYLLAFYLPLVGAFAFNTATYALVCRSATEARVSRSTSRSLPARLRRRLPTIIEPTMCNPLMATFYIHPGWASGAWTRGEVKALSARKSNKPNEILHETEEDEYGATGAHDRACAEERRHDPHPDFERACEARNSMGAEQLRAVH